MTEPDCHFSDGGGLGVLTRWWLGHITGGEKDAGSAVCGGRFTGESTRQPVQSPHIMLSTVVSLCVSLSAFRSLLCVYRYCML